MSRINADLCTQVIANRLVQNSEEIDKHLSRRDCWQLWFKHSSGVTLEVTIDASKRKEVSSDDEEKTGETADTR